MKRKLYSKLLEWKDSADRKPLIIYGARQVGKTWLLKEFGNKEYKNMVYVNCHGNN
jgi:predicted AAA+ superfamily ATPase